MEVKRYQVYKDYNRAKTWMVNKSVFFVCLLRREIMSDKFVVYALKFPSEFQTYVI